MTTDIYNLKIHKEFIKEHNNSDTMIIFIHGILESPNQFINLCEIAYNKGFSICSLLLPGHGSNGRDFSKSNHNLWELHIDKTINTYKNRYKNILFVGHSMGCLLSLSSTLKNIDTVKGLVLIATPLKVHLKPCAISNSLKVAFGLVNKSDTLAVAMKNAWSIEKSSLLTYLTWIPRYIDLFYLIYYANKNLNNIDINMLLVQCDKDELVSNKSFDILKNKLGTNNKKFINLQNSCHFYYDKNDEAYLNKEFELFLNSYMK